MARQQTSNYKLVQPNSHPDLPLIGLTEFTMSADYIHSAELVNMRYSRQTIPNAIVLRHIRMQADAAL